MIASRGGRVERILTPKCHSLRGREGLVAQPVDLTNRNDTGGEHLFRADNDLFVVHVQLHHIERFRQAADTEATALTNRVVNDALVFAKHAAIHMNDFTRFGAPGRSFSITPA